MAQVKLEAVRNRYPKKKRLLDDCIQIRHIMSGGFYAALKQLEAEVSQFIQQNGTKKKALTTVLKNAEQYCGLNPCAPIYMRFLTAEEFGQYGGKGMLFKDVGAGYLHGEYTHRIQWYVLFHIMSNGFTQDVKNVAPKGWNHTPRQLLIEINTGGIQLVASDWPMSAPEGNQGFWDALLDRGPGPIPTFNPFEDGISNPEIFSTMLMDKAWLQANHNNLHQQLDVIDQMPNYAGCYGFLSALHPNLSSIVTERYVKRETSNLYANRGAYITKKVSQADPKTAYVPLGTPDASLGVLKVQAEDVMQTRLEEERRKGHCFLTTACVQARGLPDDCEELQVLRGFRDGYLRQLPGGPGLIQEYYALAPRIVERIHHRADARHIWEDVYATVRTAVEHVQRREPEAALRTYSALVKGLSERYLG
ncbi:hypothetical protein JRI60_49685 [Archangium violaceum]|uniref:LirA/MavJ family T4SS effector n=1 Tax=Archangium violaceum TaxID=83451 RepID=UPI0019528920|nr:LirA/MavJ family T4SS effector [Archangium violaceum]QRN96955.1 hypothetical protein JRI60_49685 [Archangium violaceum]